MAACMVTGVMHSVSGMYRIRSIHLRIEHAMHGGSDEHSSETQGNGSSKQNLINSWFTLPLFLAEKSVAGLHCYDFSADFFHLAKGVNDRSPPTKYATARRC